eukprot:TCALIF_06214-PA protein Name:"Similar to FR FMRFamide receptor (Drosophila melanogaster)" AED:0.09 eAED:0.10 QI:0/0.33/0/0.5/1/1/4/0/453
MDEAFLMPFISACGIIGNCVSFHILRKREVKLKEDFVDILCSLATFDNLLLISIYFLFSLPTQCGHYAENYFPYTVPYLYPLTNVFMTCSGYMTACVGINRYLDLIDMNPNVKRAGYIQALIVLIMASLVNVPRWFEFEYQIETLSTDLTPGNESMKVFINTTKVVARTTDLRKDEDYVRDYTLIASSVLVVFLPTLCMFVTTVLISRDLMRVTKASNALNNSQEEKRRKRNRNITCVLVMIIVLFMVTHVGEIFIALYEMSNLRDGKRGAFPTWAKNIVTTNHLLIVINSSLNFVIYCKDVVFRRCLLTVYRAWSIRKQMGIPGDVTISIHSMAAQQLRSLNSELGINLHGDPSPEVILRELDPQSMILCGLSPASRTYQRPNGSTIQGCVVRFQTRGSDPNSSGEVQDQASRDLKKFGYSLSDCSIAMDSEMRLMSPQPLDCGGRERQAYA